MDHKYKIFKLNDDVQIQIISYSDEMMTARIWFTGGGFPDTHHHRNQEVNVVVAGTFEATRGDEKYLVHPGDVVSVTGDTEHDMKCLTPTGEMVSTWVPARKDMIEKFAVPA